MERSSRRGHSNSLPADPPPALFALLAGIFCVEFLLAWVCMVPLFVVVEVGFRRLAAERGESAGSASIECGESAGSASAARRVPAARRGPSIGSKPPNPRLQSALAGLVVGTVLAICGFSWMIPGAERFTGSGRGCRKNSCSKAAIWRLPPISGQYSANWCADILDRAI